MFIFLILSVERLLMRNIIFYNQSHFYNQKIQHEKIHLLWWSVLLSTTFDNLSKLIMDIEIMRILDHLLFRYISFLIFYSIAIMYYHIIRSNQ